MYQKFKQSVFYSYSEKEGMLVPFRKYKFDEAANSRYLVTNQGNIIRVIIEDKNPKIKAT